MAGIFSDFIQNHNWCAQTSQVTGLCTSFSTCLCMCMFSFIWSWLALLEELYRHTAAVFGLRSMNYSTSSCSSAQDSCRWVMVIAELVLCADMGCRDHQYSPEKVKRGLDSRLTACACTSCITLQPQRFLIGLLCFGAEPADSV